MLDKNDVSNIAEKIETVEMKHAISFSRKKPGDFLLPSNIAFIQNIFFGGGKKFISFLVVNVTMVACCLMGVFAFWVPGVQSCDDSGFGTCSNAQSQLSTILYFVGALALVVNAIFGYNYCLMRRQSRLLQWIIAYDSSFSAKDLKSKLNRIGWFSIVIFFVNLLIWLSIAISFVAVVDPQGWAFIPGNIGFCFNYCTSFYLCAMWMWENWLMHKVAQCMTKKYVTTNAILGCDGLNAGNKIYEVLEKMNQVSSVWTFNHIARTVLVIVNATCHLLIVMLLWDTKKQVKNSVVRSVRNLLDSIMILFALGLYLFVFLTVLCPGYVTDELFSNVQIKLADIADADNPQDTSILQCRQENVRTIENRATLLMMRVEIMHGKRGMHFAGLPMTVPIALTLGTFISYLVCDIVFLRDISGSF